MLDQATLAEATRLKHRVVFVCGAHRSGTTLVNQLLDGHSALAVLPTEGTYYTSLRRRVVAGGERELQREWIERLVDPNLGPSFKLGMSAERYVELARAQAAFSGLTRDQGELGPHVALLLAWAYLFHGRLEPIAWLVEKTPGNERYAPQLTGRVHGAKFLHVLRDPRAIYASQLELAKKYAFEVNRGSVLEAIRRSFVLARENAARLGERYRVLRYEELVAERTGTMSGVLAWLGLSAEAINEVQSEAGIAAPHNSSFARPGVGGELNAAEKERVVAWVGEAAGAYAMERMTAWRIAWRRLEVAVRWARQRGIRS